MPTKHFESLEDARKHVVDGERFTVQARAPLTDADGFMVQARGRWLCEFDGKLTYMVRGKRCAVGPD